MAEGGGEAAGVEEGGGVAAGVAEGGGVAAGVAEGGGVDEEAGGGLLLAHVVVTVRSIPAVQSPGAGGVEGGEWGGGGEELGLGSR